MTWDWLFKLVAKVIAQLIILISPELRALIEKFILDLWERAKASENVWDDMFVKLLAGLLDVELP